MLWGLVIGWFTALLVAAVVGTIEHRRIVRLRERAKQAERLAELGILTGGLAHEIKNPLSTIQLNLQLAQEDLPGGTAFARLKNRLNLCEREAARLRETLDDFLRFAGKIELDPSPVSLNALCEELVDFFYPQAQLAKVQLRLRKAPEEVVVHADERLLKQAVLNLMLNGIQAMPQGGDLILAVGGTPTHGRVDVIDTGTGIEKDQVDRIFDAYHTTKKSGTGLGLAMTRRIIQEHGGTVTVDSEPGKGSDFVLRLPRGGPAHTMKRHDRHA
jgi:signal transduction histidine kinase